MMQAQMPAGFSARAAHIVAEAPQVHEPVEPHLRAKACCSACEMGFHGEPGMTSLMKCECVCHG